MNKKILFTDLDNTLLTTDKRVLPENRSAIDMAVKLGHAVVLTSGRPLPAMMSLIEDLQLHGAGCYAIAYNGGLVYDCFNKEILYQKTIPLEYVRYIHDQSVGMGLHFQTYDDAHVLCEEDNEAIRFYQKTIPIEAVIDPDLMNHMVQEPSKVLVTDLHNPDKLLEYRNSMKSWAEGKVDIFFSNANYLEHVAKGISKGNAIHFLCEHLQVSIENTIAAGDGENDISMLEAAGLGAAMINGLDMVKDMADYVTVKDNNHGGFAEIVQKFMLDDSLE